jgi:hypothetical protein
MGKIEAFLLRVRLPNTRLKLSAPVRNGYAGGFNIPCCRIPFVNTSSLRRSLSAIR